MKSEKLQASLELIQQKLSADHAHGQKSGLLLMGGGEGAETHRHAVDWMGKWVDKKVLLFEPPEYVAGKVRQGRFLPLAIGLSMWAHHPGVDYLSLVPNQGKIPANDFYQQVHNATGAQYHFASEDDPHHGAKVRRGKVVLFCSIPTLNAPSTTLRTQKLMPDRGSEEVDLDL